MKRILAVAILITLAGCDSPPHKATTAELIDEASSAILNETDKLDKKLKDLEEKQENLNYKIDQLQSTINDLKRR